MAIGYNQVGWFEIPVTDLPRATAFYQNVFGVELESQRAGDMKLACFPMKSGEAGTAGSLVQAEGYTPSDQGVLVYFSVGDIENTCAEAAAGGGGVLQEKMSIGEHGFTALLQDTEGNKIGIHTRT